MATVKRGDIVTTEMHPSTMGLVIRVARDGSWADVDWGRWSKRMRNASALIKPKEVPVPGLSGGGYTCTLIQTDGVDLPSKGA